MALTIPHPSHTGTRSASLIMSAVVIVASVAFGGYQVATNVGGNSGSQTGSAVQTVDPVDTGELARLAEAAGLTGASVTSLSGTAVEVARTPVERAAAAQAVDAGAGVAVPASVELANRLAEIEARYPGGGEAPDVGIFAPSTPVHPLAGVGSVAPSVPNTPAHPLTGATAQNGPDTTPDRVGPGGQFN